MTARIIEILDHQLLLIAEGNVLVGSRWVESTPDCMPSSSEEEQRVLDLAQTRIMEYIEGRRAEFNIPLRLEGTPFRMKVWQELQNIPYGSVITYGELARRIGNPKASRAVANACGANPLPIIVPCHRVVASGGRLGGYTGGTDIKESLLQIEFSKTGINKK